MRLASFRSYRNVLVCLLVACAEMCTSTCDGNCDACQYLDYCRVDVLLLLASLFFKISLSSTCVVVVMLCWGLDDKWVLFYLILSILSSCIVREQQLIYSFACLGFPCLRSRDSQRASSTRCNSGDPICKATTGKCRSIILTREVKFERKSSILPVISYANRIAKLDPISPSFLLHPIRKSSTIHSSGLQADRKKDLGL